MYRRKNNAPYKGRSVTPNQAHYIREYSQTTFLASSTRFIFLCTVIIFHNSINNVNKNGFLFRNIFSHYFIKLPSLLLLLILSLIPSPILSTTTLLPSPLPVSLIQELSVITAICVDLYRSQHV